MREMGLNADREIVGVQHKFDQDAAVLFGFAPSLLFPVGGSKYERCPKSNDGL